MRRCRPTAWVWRSRGVREGARADLVVFDAARVADRATYQEPHRYAAGVEHVVVNGRVVIEGGSTQVLCPAGCSLPRSGWR